MGVGGISHPSVSWTRGWRRHQQAPHSPTHPRAPHSAPNSSTHRRRPASCPHVAAHPSFSPPVPPPLLPRHRPQHKQHQCQGRPQMLPPHQSLPRAGQAQEHRQQLEAPPPAAAAGRLQDPLPQSSRLACRRRQPRSRRHPWAALLPPLPAAVGWDGREHTLQTGEWEGL